MKILFLTNKPPYPKKDGGSIATMGMIEAFADSGHQVTVLAMNTRKHHVSPFQIPENISSKIIFHLVEVAARILPLEALVNLISSRLPYNAQRFISKTYREKLKTLLQATQFDIIQLEGLYLCPYISTIRKHSNALVSYRSHNIEHEIWQRTVVQSKGLKKFYLKMLTSRLKQFETDALNTYDTLVPITKRDEEKLLEMGNIKPALTIPAGFNISNTKTSEQKTIPNNLFFIGALDWSPNQEGLFWFLDNCWQIILDQKPKTTLKIAGRNAQPWLTEKLNNYPNIKYEGEVDDAAVFMQENGIFIAPLLSGSGMRVKIIEGMMYQKCIITTPVGCEGIKALNKEHLYIAKNHKQFSDMTINLLTNKKKAIETGQKAYNFVRSVYDNQKLIGKLTTFYNQQLK
ncbi:MAG: glycosyltransferase family 4 protein [Prolixibacteraceae bacterium]|nr:glycosyltransferase family 4 protein [Prolixibacteraceae bacterium]